MGKKVITYFSKDWFKDPDFEDWIASASNNTETICQICCKNFKPSNMGRQAFVCHANGKKHKLHVNRKQMFFKPKKVIVLDQETVQTSVSSSQDTEQTIDIAVNDSTQTSSSFSQDTERTIDLMLNDPARRKSEVIWALKSVCSGYSNNSS